MNAIAFFKDEIYKETTSQTPFSIGFGKNYDINLRGICGLHDILLDEKEPRYGILTGAKAIYFFYRDNFMKTNTRKIVINSFETIHSRRKSDWKENILNILERVDGNPVDSMISSSTTQISDRAIMMEVLSELNEEKRVLTMDGKFFLPRHLPYFLKIKKPDDAIISEAMKILSELPYLRYELCIEKLGTLFESKKEGYANRLLSYLIENRIL